MYLAVNGAMAGLLAVAATITPTTFRMRAVQHSAGT